MDPYSAHNLSSGEALECIPSSTTGFSNSCLVSGFSRLLHHLTNVDHMERKSYNLRVFLMLGIQYGKSIILTNSNVIFLYATTDKINEPVTAA